MSLSDSWENFLDWSEERGLPFKAWSDKLDEMGVPSLPVAILLVLLLVVLGLVFVLPALSTTPAGDVTVTVTSQDGRLLQGINVKIASAEAEPLFELQEGVTDASGTVTFAALPPGKAKVTASSEDYAPVDGIIDVVSGKTQPVSLFTQPVTQSKVTLSLDVAGPSDPESVTTVLFSKDYNLLETKTGLKPTFNVAPNDVYQAKVTAKGYSDQMLTGIQTTDSGAFRQVTLTLLPVAKDGVLHVTVVTIDGDVEKPVVNASVEVIDAATKVTLQRGLVTGTDGAIDPVKATVGTQVQVRATKLGYQPKLSETTQMADSTEVKLELRDAGPTIPLVITAQTAEGSQPIDGATIKTYEKQHGAWVPVDEKKTVDGYVEFAIPKDKTYAAAVYAPGRIPVFYPATTPPAMTARLQKATSLNSAVIRVHASNFDGSDASGASIAIDAADGTPLGLPGKIAGIDGVQEFADIPLIQLRITASSRGRTGTATVDAIAGNQTAEVQLARGTGKVNARVIDHFTQKPITGAKFAIIVAAGDNESSCLTNEAGECSLTTTEQLGAGAAITVAGYDKYFAAAFSVTAGGEANVEAELMPTSVASSTKPEFAGFYNVAGKKVKSLSPSSEYRARFIVRSPAIGFDNATLFVYLGKPGDELDKSDAVITGYSGEANQIFAGESFVGANQPGVDAATLASGGDSATQNNDTGAAVRESKWVAFQFAPFSGTRAYDVVITTRPVTDGTAELSYRTEYSTAREILRSPVDASAPTNATTLLAKSFTEKASISFEGTCDKDLCIAYHFEQDGVSYSPDSFEAEIGKEFSLIVNAIAFNEPVTAKLESAGESIGVLRAESGGDTTPSTATGVITQATATITPDKGPATFTMRGQRLAKDAKLALTLSKKSGAASEKQFFVRVNAKGSPELKVTYTPRSINALTATNIEFTVRDNLGLAVDNAKVTLGGTSDALGRTLEATATDAGKYAAEGLVAGGAGNIAVTVESEGFSKYTGKIPVYAQKLIEVRETGLELNVVGREAIEAAFSATNLLSNELSVSVTIVKSNAAKYTDLAVIPSAGRIAPNGAFNAVLAAQVADAVAGIADKASALSETITGTLRIVAGTGSSRQAVELPFKVSTKLSQSDMTSSWALDVDSLAIELTPPANSQAKARIKVTNNAPQTLLFNEQLSMRGVAVSPASMVLLPGDSDYFDLTATASTKYSSAGCVFDEAAAKGVLTIIGTYQNLRSTRDVPVTVTTHASGKCSPNDPRQVTLPIDVDFEIPTNAKLRTNDDATVTLEAADGTRLSLAAASPSNGVVRAAANVPFTVEERFVSGTAGEFALVLPFAARLIVPAEIPRIIRDGKVILVFGQTTIEVPSTAGLAADDAVMRIPAGATIQIRPLPKPDLGSYARVKLPAGLSLQFPGNSLQVKNADGSTTVGLPNGLFIGVPPQAELGETLADGSFTATLRSGDTILLPPALYSRLSGKGFSLTLPFAYGVEVPSDVGAGQRGDNVVVFLYDYDLVLPNRASFAASQNGKIAALNAGSRIEFRDFSRDALASSSTYATLPASLSLQIPAGTRIESTGAGITIALAAGQLIGLPTTATIGTAQVDGSTTVTVQQDSRVALPLDWAVIQPNGALRMTIPLQHYWSVPAGTPVLQQGSTTTLQLADYDLVLPKTAVTESSDAITTKPTAGTSESLVPVPEIALPDEAGRLSLPFTTTLNLPLGTRLSRSADGIAVLLPTGEKIGATNADVSETGRQITIPANGNLFLQPSRVVSGAGANGNGITVTLPMGGVLSFDAGQRFTQDGATVIVGDDYKVTLQPNARVQATDAAVEATLPIDGSFTLEPTEFNAVGRTQALPVAIAIDFPASAIVRQKSDGSIYAEAFGNRFLFGAGSTLEKNRVSIPANTIVTFPYNSITTAGTPAGFSSVQSSYRLSLPLAFQLTAPQLGDGTNSNMATNKDGTKSIALQDLLVILPRQATTTTVDGSINAVVPANSAVAFYYSPVLAPGAAPQKPTVSGVTPTPIPANSAGANGKPLPTLTDEEKAAAAQKQEEARIAAALASNALVMFPVATEFTIPVSIEFKTDAGTAGPIAWLTKTTAVVFPSSASVNVATDGSRVVAVPDGSSISLPKSYARGLSDGGVSVTLPFAAVLTLPDGTTTSLASGYRVAYAETINTLITADASSGIQNQKIYARAGGRVEFRPLAQPSFANNVPVRMPFDVTLNLPSDARTSTTGTTTTVWFPDGSVAQFQGDSQQQSNSASRVLLWQANTQALLPIRLVQSNPYTGAQIITLPVPLIIEAGMLAGGDASIQRRGTGIRIVIDRTMAEAPVATIIAPGRIAIPAGAPLSVGPFGLDAYGPTVMLPFELSIYLPPGTTTDEHAPGGIAVEFPNGVRAKFGGSSTISQVNSGPTQYLPSTIGSQLPGGATNPYAQYGVTVINPYGTDAQNVPAIAYNNDRGSTLSAPKLAPITLPPALLTMGATVESGAATPESYSVVFPSSTQLSFDSESPVYTNPDQSYSIFSGDVEIRLPPTAARATESAGSGVGRVVMNLPAGQRVTVNKIYSGKIPGDSVTLPFDLVLKLPAQARVLPLAQDGTRTLDFGNGARAVFERDLLVDERKVNGAGGFNELVVSAGTSVVWTQGIVKPLGKDTSPQYSAKPGFELALPCNSVVRVPNGIQTYKGRNGETLAFFQQADLVLPATAQPTSDFVGGVNSYAVTAGQPIRMTPRTLSYAVNTNGFTLPFDSILSIPAGAYVNPEAQDGSRSIDFSSAPQTSLASGTISLDSDRSLVFPAGTAIDKASVKLPAGATFYPAKSLLSIKDSTTSKAGATATTTVSKLTTPAAIVIQPSDPIDHTENKDGTITVYAGSQEVVFGPGTKVQAAGNKKQFIVPAGSYIQIGPVDSSLSQNTATLSLPVDAAFVTYPDTRILPPGAAGERAVVYGPGRVLVVNQDATFKGSPATLSVPAGSPIQASSPLVRPFEVNRRTETTFLPPGVRFATPSQTTLTVPQGMKAYRDPTRGSIVITNGYDEVVIPGSAQQQQARGQATKSFTITANSIIEVRPIDYDTTGLKQINLPARAVFNIPAGSRVDTNPDNGIVVVTLPGGARFALEGAKAVEDNGRVVKLDLPQSAALRVEPDWTSEITGGFELRMPINWKLVLPANAEKPKAMPNTIRLPSGTAITTEFDPVLEDGSGESGDSAQAKRLDVPASARISFSPTTLAAEEEIEKNGGGKTGTFIFTAREAIRITVKDAKENSNGESAAIVLPGCQDLEADAQSDNYKLYRLPAASGVLLDNVEIDGDTLTIESGAKVTLKTCNPGSESAVTIYYYPRSDTTYYIPVDSEPKDNPVPEVDFKTCRELKLFGAQPPVDAAKKLGFPGDSKLYPDPQIESALLKDKKKQVTVPAGGETKIVSCQNPIATGDARYDPNENKPALEITPSPQILEVRDFNRVGDKTTVRENTTEVYLKSLLSENLKVSANVGQGGVRGELKKYVDSKDVVWAGGFQETTAEVIVEAGKAGTPYRITARITPDSEFVDPLTGCFKKPANNAAYTDIKGEVVFNVVSEKTNEAKQPGILPFTLRIVPSPTCTGANTDAGPVINGVYATSADSITTGGTSGMTQEKINRKLTFKAPGHVRYFAIVNNRPEAVTLHEEWQSGKKNAECKIADSVTFAAATPKDEAIEGRKLGQGDSVFVKCTSLATTTYVTPADYQITAVGDNTKDDGKTTILFRVNVYKPDDQVKGLYPSSPIGVLARQDERAFDASADIVPDSTTTTGTGTSDKTTTTTGSASGTEKKPGTPTTTPTPTPVPRTAKAEEMTHISFADAPAGSATDPALKSLGGVTATDPTGSLTTTPAEPGVWRLCEEKFCSSAKVASGVQAFVTGIYDSLYRRLQITEGSGEKVSEKLNAMYKTTDNGVVRKAFVIQKAGRDSVTLGDLQKAIDDGRAENHWTASATAEIRDATAMAAPSSAASSTLANASTPTPSNELAGCGIWLASAELRLKPAPALGQSGYESGADVATKYLDDSQITFVFTKVHSCEESLNNLALLTGMPDKKVVGSQVLYSPEFFIGQERVEGNWAEIANGFKRVKAKFAGDKVTGRVLGAIHVGPYRDVSDAEDQEAARRLYEAMYNNGQTGTGFAEKSANYLKGSQYDGHGGDAARFCVGRSAPIIAKVGGLIFAESAAITALSAVTFAGTGGATGVTGIAGALASNAGRALVQFAVKLFAKDAAMAAVKSVGGSGVTCAGGALGGFVGGAPGEGFGDGTCTAVNTCITFQIFDAATLGVGSLVNPGGATNTVAGIGNRVGSLGAAGRDMAVVGGITAGVTGIANAVDGAWGPNAAPVAVRSIRGIATASDWTLQNNFIDSITTMTNPSSTTGSLFTRGEAQLVYQDLLTNGQGYLNGPVSGTLGRTGTAVERAVSGAGFGVLPATDVATLEGVLRPLFVAEAEAAGALLGQVVGKNTVGYPPLDAAGKPALDANGKPVSDKIVDEYQRILRERAAATPPKSVAFQDVMDDLINRWRAGGGYFIPAGGAAPVDILVDNGWLTGTTLVDASREVTSLTSTFSGNAAALAEINGIAEELAKGRVSLVANAPAGATVGVGETLEDILNRLDHPPVPASTDPGIAGFRAAVRAELAARQAAVVANDAALVDAWAAGVHGTPRVSGLTRGTGTTLTEDLGTFVETKRPKFNGFKIDWSKWDKRATAGGIAAIAVAMMFDVDVRPAVAQTLPVVDSFVVATQDQPFRKLLYLDSEPYPLPSVAYVCELDKNGQDCGKTLINVASACQFTDGRRACILYGKKSTAPGAPWLLTAVITKDVNAAASIAGGSADPRAPKLAATPGGAATPAATDEKTAGTTTVGPVASELFDSLFLPDYDIRTWRYAACVAKVDVASGTVYKTTCGSTPGVTPTTPAVPGTTPPGTTPPGTTPPSTPAAGASSKPVAGTLNGAAISVTVYNDLAWKGKTFDVIAFDSTSIKLDDPITYEVRGTDDKPIYPKTIARASKGSELGVTQQWALEATGSMMDTASVGSVVLTK